MTNLYQRIKTKIQVFGLLLFTMATSFCSYAQERNDDEIDLILDDLFFDDKQFLDELIESDVSFNFLYTSVAYNTNTYFSGRDSGTDQFNMIPQISYYHSSGFNATVSGIYYESFDPHWDFTSVSLSYLNTLGKSNRIIYNLGYTKYFYNDDFDDFTNSIDVSLGFRNKKRTLGTTLSASYLFGSDESYQLVSSSFARINLLRKTNFAVRLRPTLSFVAAKQVFTYNQLFRTRPFLRTVTEEVFNVLNTQISLPISLTTNAWDFELGYSINLPNAVANEADLPTTNFFSFTVGYLFDLSK
ncbi:MAG: hypothetical protein AB8B78_07270 [Polaribacter sp.]